MDAAVNHVTTKSTSDIDADCRAADPWHLALVAAGTRAELDAGTALLRARHDEMVAPRNGIVEVHAAGLEIGRQRGAVLAGADGVTVLPAAASHAAEPVPVAFMFPGLGDHYLNMAEQLYRGLPVFRRHVDRCVDLLVPELGVDLREVIFAAGPETRTSAPAVDLRRMLGRDGAGRSRAEERLDRTAFAQPALFVVEYALARLWQSLGVHPDIMIGYSLGEYVAACLAGVLSLEDSLKLVARRARLIEESPRGSMLAVMVSEERIAPLVSDRVSLSAVNGPEFCVVAGHTEDVAAIEATLSAQGVVTRRVQSTHAFHSVMMEPLADAVTELVSGFTLTPPRIPYISNVTGKQITDAEATDPAYWARHLCSPVRFADGLVSIGTAHALLETGPGQTLSSMATTVAGPTGTVVASMRHALENQPDTAVLLKALGRLWTAGAEIDWASLPVSSLALPDRIPPVPSESGAATDRELTATERRLAGLWARLLPGDSLPVDVSFFELGGNSLLATRLILRVTREFGVELTLRRIYEMSTITRMAAAIDALLSGTDTPEETPAGSTAGADPAAKPRFELPNGLWIHHQNEAETRHFYEDIFDHRTYAKHGITIPDGATVVDVGGNIGMFTLFAHYAAKNVRLLTFEPAPPLFELLSRNVAEHGVRAELFNMGISDAETTATLTFYPRSAGMSSFHPDEAEEKSNLRTIIANQQKAGIRTEVDDRFVDDLVDVRFESVEFTARLRTLSAVLAEQGVERIDLIKIDVQKAEQQVIDGIADTDWPKIQQMVLEAHDSEGRVARLVELLESKGFTVLAEQDELYVGTDIHNIYATRG